MDNETVAMATISVDSSIVYTCAESEHLTWTMRLFPWLPVQLIVWLFILAESEHRCTKHKQTVIVLPVIYSCYFVCSVAENVHLMRTSRLLPWLPGQLVLMIVWFLLLFVFA